MTPEELEQQRDAYFGTIAANLWHTLNAQQRWLARWNGESMPRLGRPTIASWPAAYAETHAALRRLVAPLTADDLRRPVKYTLRVGVVGEQPLGELLVHLVNHGSHHRAEVGLLLERMGRSPGDMDYVLFLTQSQPS
jgi:uncharacterized damage-inducible protein DinB